MRGWLYYIRKISGPEKLMLVEICVRRHFFVHSYFERGFDKVDIC